MGGHQATVEHQKILEAREKYSREWDLVLVWNISLQGQDRVLVSPWLLVEQCPVEQGVLPLVFAEEEGQGLGLKRSMTG